MSLKHGLLGLLRYGEMTGYELNAAFEASLHYFWRAQKSQIYRELKAMEDAGWVKSRVVIQTDRPNKRLYCIAEQGETELVAWLRQPLYRHEERMHSELLLQLFFASALPREENVQNITALKAYCAHASQILSQDPEDAIQSYGKAVDDPQEALYWRFTADFGRRYYQMVADWAQGMLDNLTDDEGHSANVPSDVE